MPIIGLEFDKINIEKKNKITGKISIKNDLMIKSVEKEEVPSKKDEIIKVNFEYNIQYRSDIGSILLKGHLLFMDNIETIQESLKEWDANKKLPEEIMGKVINSILLKSNIKALVFSQEVNLPPHIRLPLVKPKEE